ncbi:premelanosome protein a [Solea solea]|uniref:premelanosome protein a n=1 Tax=Solea solea TaxID=90069 RepID=UPI00272C6F52|nr:premelanosome protein a [Solea solea]
MTTQALVLLVLAFTSASAIQRRSQFTRYRSWNSKMYPVWKDGDARFRNCWFGGEVTFDVKNDAPTLTGAKTTFNINLNFPPNQTVLTNGQVVWAQNCTINGQQYQQGQAVYPDQDTPQVGLFPDGSRFTRSQEKKPHYVFVWKTWGRYWQVADGPSSSLTIGTDNVPLGSYNMEVVIYHCRGKNKFIPLGYASSVFIVTDQVPFSLSLSQVNDINQDDQNFIQNRAIAFSVNLHDPSQYLSTADISFSWDFGDSSGTLISRERTVTHTFLTVGTFKPQVVLMATISNGCANPTAVATIDASAVPADGGDVIALDVPASDATPQAANTEDAAATDNTDAEAAEVASVAPAGVDAAVVPEEQDPANTVAPAAEVEVTAEETDATAEEAETTDPVAEEPADADVAVAGEAVVVTDAAEEDVPVVDAAVASVAPVAVEVAAGVTVAPVAEEPVEQEAEVVATAAAAVDAAAIDAAAADAVDTVAVDAVDTAAVDAVDTAAVDAAAAVDAVDAVDTAAVDAAADAVDAAAADAVDAVDAAAAAVDGAADAIDGAADAVDAAAADVVDADAEVVQAETEAPADNVVAPVATEATAVEETAPADTEAEVQETENEVVATAAAAEQAAEGEGEVQAEVEADPAQIALVVAKRQAPELTADCMVYRYGSLAATVDVVQGIESVEIVQVTNVVAVATELNQNAVDVTISCQGSLPSEVCTVISDADCITPVETVCNIATPSPDCQMVLRQFFNDSGVFCLNVSLTNDVSLAVASARVSVTVASGGSPAGTAATVLGVMVLACVVCCIGLMYRRSKQYQPLTEDHVVNNGGSSAVTSVPLLLWNLLSRQSPGESRPLLQGRLV